MSAVERPVDQDRKSRQDPNLEGELLNGPAVEELLTRLKQDMRHGKPGQDAIAAALQAIQRLALEADVEGLAEETAEARPAKGRTCPACGNPNREGNRFCSRCGVALPEAAIEEERRAGVASARSRDEAQPSGQHHYHHHYHHHYFSPGEGGPAAANSEPRPPSAAAAARDAVRLRAPLTGPSLSRAEAAVRQLTQDWALACNTKQLDDLVDLYAADALVFRPNVPPVRGTAAIREFFFGLLDAGMGEVEMEPIRAEVLGDVAYEAGRCKSLVPVALSKRREERGKYVLVLNRATPAGEWKIATDSWSGDLNLGAPVEPSKANVPGPGGAMPKPPRKP
jgi:ketosteroid isomerase-like protein